MYKILIPFIFSAIIACNSNQNNTADSKTSGTDTANTKLFSWTTEDEREFLGECVDNAKTQLGDTAAFARCKCVLEQLKKDFPSMDSASSVLMDTAKAAQYALKCK